MSYQCPDRRRAALRSVFRLRVFALRRIQVYTIRPGPIDNTFQLSVEDGLGEEIGRDGTEFFNEIIPPGHHSSPDEIARSVLYLASDQGSFTTGAMPMADGGMSA